MDEAGLAGLPPGQHWYWRMTLRSVDCFVFDQAHRPSLATIPQFVTIVADNTYTERVLGDVGQLVETVWVHFTWTFGGGSWEACWLPESRIAQFDAGV